MINFEAILLLALLLVLSGVVESNPTRALFDFGKRGSKVKDLRPITDDMVIDLKHARRFLKRNDPMTCTSANWLRYKRLVCIARF
jgi:hypothetical protein